MASVHNSKLDDYKPPQAVAQHLIAHAIRNLPNKEVLMKKIYPQKFNHLYGLKPHEYNSSGKLQFGFLN